MGLGAGETQLDPVAPLLQEQTRGASASAMVTARAAGNVFGVADVRKLVQLVRSTSLEVQHRRAAALQLASYLASPEVTTRSVPARPNPLPSVVAAHAHTTNPLQQEVIMEELLTTCFAEMDELDAPVGFAWYARDRHPPLLPNTTAHTTAPRSTGVIATVCQHSSAARLLVADNAAWLRLLYTWLVRVPRASLNVARTLAWSLFDPALMRCIAARPEHSTRNEFVHVLSSAHVGVDSDRVILVANPRHWVDLPASANAYGALVSAATGVPARWYHTLSAHGELAPAWALGGRVLPRVSVLVQAMVPDHAAPLAGAPAVAQLWCTEQRAALLLHQLATAATHDAFCSLLAQLHAACRASASFAAHVGGGDWQAALQRFLEVSQDHCSKQYCCGH